MIYKIRAILDVKKDVIRDVLIDSSCNLAELHKEIAKAFGFNGQEMASFYLTDDEWNQGEEIPLFDMSDAGESPSMQTSILGKTLEKKGEKLIYVYDFMSMWTFFIEVSETIKETEKTLPAISFAFGDVPETAPEKEFTVESSMDDFNSDNEDAFNDSSNFDNIDDYDF
jgi:hypothetical protein